MANNYRTHQLINMDLTPCRGQVDRSSILRVPQMCQVRLRVRVPSILILP